MSFSYPPVHGKEPLPTLDASEVQEVRKELCAIRDKVNALIDAIDRVPKTSSSSSTAPEGEQVSLEVSLNRANHLLKPL